MDAPRFTLNELREVLQEKNLLKARVLELEEQLEAYRCTSSASQTTLDTTLADRREEPVSR